MKILINNQTSYKLSEVIFRRVVRIAEAHLKFDVDELSVSFLPPDAMAEVNSRYRRQTGPATVLTFDYGEILLSPKYIQSKYHLKRTELMPKLIELFIHGLVHLGGYDHSNLKNMAVMQRIEEKIIKCYYR